MKENQFSEILSSISMNLSIDQQNRAEKRLKDDILMKLKLLAI